MDSGVVPYIEEGFASAEFVEAGVPLSFSNTLPFFSVGSTIISGLIWYHNVLYRYYIGIIIGLYRFI